MLALWALVGNRFNKRASVLGAIRGTSSRPFYIGDATPDGLDFLICQLGLPGSPNYIALEKARWRYFFGPFDRQRQTLSEAPQLFA
jgi:hypothetical protein